jgi:hypothetical protein
MKDVSCDMFGFDFTMVSPNIVHLDESKMSGLSVGDEVKIFVKNVGQSYTFKIKRLFFNGFEYE